MKIGNSLVTAGVMMALAFAASADLIDDFDSYADNAALTTAWTVNAGAGLVLNTSESVSAPNSVVNPGTDAASIRRNMPSIPASDLNFSFQFYDYDGGFARDYGMLYSRNGDEWTGGLNNLLAIGKFNNVLTNHYFARVAYATGATYGDGAVVNGTWFALTGGPTRSVGWHTAQVLGEPDPVNVGKVIYKFYIDGVLGGSAGNLADIDYNWTVLGSGLSTAPSGIAFDDVRVVPEPPTLLFGVFGLAGAALLRRFRVPRGGNLTAG